MNTSTYATTMSSSLDSSDNNSSIQGQVEAFIDLPENRFESEEFRGDLSPLKLIPHFLTKSECDFFISLISPDSKNRIQYLSNRKRLIFESEKVATWFWSRLAPFNEFKSVTDEHGDIWDAHSINPRFRLIRYDKGEEFKTHEDGFYWPSWNLKTFATAMVYLNDMSIITDNKGIDGIDGIDGKDGIDVKDQTKRVRKGEVKSGATRFHKIHTVVEPAQGLLIHFLVNDLDHCGEPVDSQKFLLRTDVFYKLREESCKRPVFCQRRQEIFKEFKRYDD